MIPSSLASRRIALDDGSTAFPYEWRGETVLVNDNARNGVEIALLFRDEGMGEEQKAVEVVSRLFVDPEDAFCACDFSPVKFSELIKDSLWDVFGLNAGGHQDEEPLWDIEQDAAIIRSSFRQAYGLDWDAARDAISWYEFLALVASLPYETPLGRAMYYRNSKNRPEKTKYNKEQVAEFDRLHDLLKIEDNTEKGSHDRIAAQQHAMDDMALAFKAKMTR